jgi:hypothetical protein
VHASSAQQVRQHRVLRTLDSQSAVHFARVLRTALALKEIDQMSWLKKLFGGQPQVDDGKDEVEIAFEALVRTNVDLDTYYALMAQAGISKPVSSRLYNLILILCGRRLMSTGEASPQFPSYYLVQGSRIDFESCEYCKRIDAYLNRVTRDTVAVFGVLSCEMGSVNSCLNEMEKKLGHAPGNEWIKKIQLYPPDLPC